MNTAPRPVGEPCRKCRGTGKVKKGRECARCGGTGRYVPPVQEESGEEQGR